MPERIGIVGVGAIGSIHAHAYHQLDHTVLINDTDPNARDRVPYPHAAKHELAENCSIIVVTLPTPTNHHGGDPSIVHTALSELTPTDATIVLRSTMPPGSTAKLAKVHEHPLVYSPEFLRDRSETEDFFTPDRIVVAGPKPERDTYLRILDAVECDTVFETTEYVAAEIAKEAHNAFFATKVSFANQIRAISERVDTDPGFVMDVVTSDTRNTTSHLDPLLGAYGGKCLPKDTEALRLFAERKGVATPLLDGTVAMNEIAEQYDERDIQGTWPDITVAGD